MKIVQLDARQECHPWRIDVHYSWPANQPTCRPFQLDWLLHEYLKQGSNNVFFPFPYVVVWTDNNRPIKICVRTDEYPSMWIYWWAVIRLHKTGEVLEQASKYIFRIWAKS